MRKLTNQQFLAVEKFKQLRVCALFMACGTGKTQAATAIINSIPKDHDVFWLCPLRTISNLKEEIALCGLDHNITYYGIESLSTDRKFLELREKIAKSAQPILVCDESLKIKNISAKRTRNILELSKLAHYKMILNGTPITKNILDIYTQMEFLSPKILRCTLNQFKRKYAVIVEKYKGNHKIDEYIKSYANVDHLLSIIEPYVFSCDLKLSVSKEHENVTYDLDDESSEMYSLLKKEMLDELKEMNDSAPTGTIVLGYLQRMQQAYCCASEKLDLVRKIADSKTIVFCKFTRSEELLKKEFPKLTVLTYGKNSLGLNLQANNKCIFFDKTFDYAFAEQSEYRIFRTGQKDNCKYYHFTAKVGLEKLFDKCIEKKISLVQYFKENGNKILEKL